MTEQDILIMNSDSTHVDVELSFDNGINTIKNNKIYSESMSLIDGISDSESIVFGKCNVSQFKVKVADFEGDIDGALMNVLLKFSNAELGTCEYNLGQYIVSDSERTSDKMFRIITAYDKMSLFNVDIANWYNYTLFPFEVVDNNLGWLPVNENGVVIDLTYSIAGEPQTSLDKNDDGVYYLNTNDGVVYVGYATYDESGEFASVEWRTYLQCEKNESYTESCNIKRTVNEILAMLCEYVGVSYNTDFVLVNGSVVVKRDFNPQSLNGLDFLQQICELNGVFGHINNNGILDFIAPDKSTKQTVDTFKKCDYSEYTVQPINSVSIKYDSNDMGTSVTRSGIDKLNQYEIVGNIFLQSVKTEDELKAIAGNILSVIENIAYVPCSVEVKCGLNFGLGDFITVKAKTIKEESVSSVSFDTLVLCRNISGIQSIFNRIEAKGTEYVSKSSESLASQLQITNKTIDKLYKDYTANTANFMYLYSKAITTDSLDANVANIGTLNANSAFVKFITGDVINSNYIRSLTADIGYLTSDSAIISSLQTDKLNTSDLNAENAKLGYLTAGSAVITGKLDANQLSAEVAKLGYLTSDSAIITSLQTDKLNTNELNSEVAKLGYLTASNAVITSLQTGKLDTSQLSAEVAKLGYLDAKMANIDFANLNKANIGQLFANVGLISSATITDGHVTGYLDSVEVNANKITAGTLAVDRLLIKDSSGNYKMATYDSSGNLVTTTVNGSVITNRTITADHLVAGTITANEINMTNLVGNSAFINAINTNSIVVSASNNASSALSTANTANSNASTALSTANSANATANSASSTANSALSTANTANSNASSAISTANSASSNASTALTNANNANTKAQGIIDNIYTPNTTTINGGKITTGSIKAAQIDVNNLFAQNITASGTITGATLKGTSGWFDNFHVIRGTRDNSFNGNYSSLDVWDYIRDNIEYHTVDIQQNMNDTIQRTISLGADSMSMTVHQRTGVGYVWNLVSGLEFKDDGRTVFYGSGEKYINGYLTVGGKIECTGSYANAFYENGTALSNKYAPISHSHDYLPLSGGTITGNLYAMSYIAGENVTSGAHNHALLMGHDGQDYWNFYEYGGVYNFYKSQRNVDTLLGKITINGWEGNVVGNVTGNASTATTSTYAINDQNGHNIIGSYNINHKNIIDLTSLDQNYWYPVTTVIPNSGMRRIRLAVQLYGYSHPSWATHSSGFTANMELLVKASGWGTTGAESICLDYNWRFTQDNVAPCGYTQMSNSSAAVLWLRGGGKYHVFTDWFTNWTIQTGSFTTSGQTVTPTTGSAPFEFTYNTIHANLNGNASTASTASYATSAGNADTVDGKHFNWSGQSGQPTWLWGGEDGTNMYVYNPSNFSVNYANSAGSAPASDVYSWAKQSTKPSYALNEITGSSDIFKIATYSYASVTISGGGASAVSPASNDIPSGYTAVAVSMLNTGTAKVYARNFLSDGSIILVNTSSSSVTTTPVMKVLCVKSTCVG